MTLSHGNDFSINLTNDSLIDELSSINFLSLDPQSCNIASFVDIEVVRGPGVNNFLSIKLIILLNIIIKLINRIKLRIEIIF